jgi:ABC-type sugar transport system substrate-binding protein
MKPRIVVSLPNDNKYQREQAVVAKAVAARLGVDLELFQADDDVITQSQQLLNIIQSPAASRPDALIVEPVSGAGLQRVAQAGVAAGIAWIVSNFNVEYLSELRSSASVPVFAVSQGQSDIGLTQGRQMAALMSSGTVLYIQGPGTSAVAVQRRLGMESSKPRDIKIRTLHSRWAEESAFQAVTAWLRLATSRPEYFGLIAAQTHELALGARRAFEALPQNDRRAQWLGLPCIGVGIARQVEPLVDRGILAAGVITATTMDVALELTFRAIAHKAEVPACTFVKTSSYPELEVLTGKSQREKGAPVLAPPA